MARFSRGYDRPYYDEGYGFGGGWGPFANQSRHRRSAGYDTDYAADRYRRRSGGYGRDRWAGGRYDQGIRYDEDYGSWQSRPRKTQWQTDYGDPFGDRQQRTPMRVIRGEPRWNERGRDDYGREYRYGQDFRFGRERRYDRDYQAWGFPQQYEPYSPQSGYHID